MNFLVDNQLPKALCDCLCANGHAAIHVADLKLDEASDLEIWNHAKARDAIVATKDEDFLHLANRRHESGKLLWVRVGNCRTAHLLREFEQGMDKISRAFAEGARIVEFR